MVPKKWMVKGSSRAIITQERTRRTIRTPSLLSLKSRSPPRALGSRDSHPPRNDAGPRKHAGAPVNLCA
jgi:hypothetical protein